MSETSKWIQDNQILLEEGLRKARGSGLKELLRQALEVGQALEREAGLLPEETASQDALVPDKLLARQLSQSLSATGLHLSGRINSAESMEQRVLLQKLVAAQDQVLYRLREFL